jgi:hypothetical protein
VLAKVEPENMIGLGAPGHQFSVYIENRPELEPYQSLQTMQPLIEAGVSSIVDATSNHWRKIFNVYAKLVFSCADFMNMPKFLTWQQLRDEYLLQAPSPFALLFSVPDIRSKGIKIITGHTYAQSLNLQVDFVTVADDFLVSTQHGLIVCPYFDYRQLSNNKIETLSRIIENLYSV